MPILQIISFVAAAIVYTRAIYQTSSDVSNFHDTEGKSVQQMVDEALQRVPNNNG